MQTKDEEEEVELETDSDYSDEEAAHQARPFRLRKGQVESHAESSEIEAEMETEMQLVATTGMEMGLTKKQKAALGSTNCIEEGARDNTTGTTQTNQETN